MLEKLHLKVNGQIHEVNIEPETPLIYVLRNDLGLKGAKLACGLDQCGACKILIDGQAVPSCRISAKSVQGKDITTIEGIGSADDLHPLQKAFIEEQAVQCGFCVSGMIMAAKALLDKNSHPTDAEIQAEMSGNLCRCGTYGRVMRAIKRASGRPNSSPPYEVVPGREETARHETSHASPTKALLQTLSNTPDLDSWVRINSDGTITLFTGKVELGQDLRTSVAMIGADELDLSLDRIRVVMADTSRSPDEGYTVSSLSLETSGNAIRYAAAEVRRLALLLSQEVLGAPVERLEIMDGTITDPATGCSVTYWDLFAGKRFNSPVLGGSQPKGPAAYKIVGRPAARLDLVAKVSGGPIFVQDLELPGMVHGRVARPPNYHASLVSIDEEALSQLPGIIQTVRDGNFLGVIAEREEQAVHAMGVLRKTSVWETGKTLPQDETLFDQLLSQEDEAFLIVDGAAVDDTIPPIQTPSGACQTLAATYYRPYHMHASLGPSGAVATWSENKLTLWSHSQGVYPLRGALAQVLKMSEEDIHVIHRDGPGCFGHNGADDAALDAALLARAFPGRPVSLKWTRADENAWEPYGPATVVKMQASLNKDNVIIDWNHDVWGYAHNSRPRPAAGSSSLLAARHLADPIPPTPYKPLLGFNGCVYRNAEPIYDLPRQRIVMHFLRESPLRVSALRGLGSYANVFALESFMDELANAAGADPVEFRLRHLTDTRARAVIEAAQAKAGRRLEDRGRGVAFARYKNLQSYVAVVVDLTVDRKSGDIRLLRAVVAADAGQIVNPDALSNQLEGVFTQSASWTLKEQVSFDQKGINSLDWHGYPILRFCDAPQIETVLLNRPGRPYLGIGEGAQGPIPAAIANAVFNNVGIRLRKIPFTPERVKAALEGL
jgi:CO/xanthine dehydrogenase Mo-binding subunit